jgi:hypothetical protein
VTNLGQMRAVPEVKKTMNLAQQYADLSYDPDALIAGLAQIVVHDNFTEMHAFKHPEAIFEESPRRGCRGAGAVASASGAAGVRVWPIMSRRRAPSAGQLPLEGA